uniref:Putative structural protein n=1 Tax=viral metagenome TaxID=1070528 RepID=A0A6M3II88_9ZZZZ
MPKNPGFNIILDEKKLIQQVEADLASDRIATQTYRSNREKWQKLALYRPENLNEEDDTSDKKEEFHVSLPLIPIAVEQTHPRFFAAYNKLRPFIKMYPTSQGDIKRIDLNQKYANWALHNNTPHFNHLFDENGLITIIEGFCPVHQTWSKESRKTKTRHFFPATYLVSDNEGNIYPIPLTVEDIINELFNTQDIRKLTDYKETKTEGEYKITYQDKVDINDWINRTAYMRVVIEENEENPEQSRIMAEVVSVEVMFEGVRMYNLDYDHVYHPKDIVHLQAPENPHIIIQCERPFAEIKARMENKIYDMLTEADLEKIRKNLLTEKNNTPEGDPTTITDANDDIQDTNKQPTAQDTVRFYECYYSKSALGKDILKSDDGIEAELIMTIFPDAEVVGRVKYLEEIFRHSIRPLSMTVFDIIPRSVLGRGLPEKLKGVQEVYDDVWNQVLNYGQVITLPFFFYLAGGNMNSDVYKLRPGEGFPLSSLDDVRFPQFTNNLPIDFAMMQQIYGHFERYGKINDPMMGRQGQARQTATATLKLLAESMESLSVNFERYKRGWCEIFMNFWQLHRAYMPERVKFRVFNQMAETDQDRWEFMEISRQDMIEHPDIDIDITIENTSSLFQRELYEHLFQLFVNPVSIQAGIIQPHNIYHLHKKVLQAYREPDEINLISKPTVMPPPVAPEIEIDMMMGGKYVQPNAQENFQEHVAQHMQVLMTKGQFIPPQIKQLILRHIKDTQQMAQYQNEMLQMSQAAGKLPQQALLPHGGGSDFMAKPDVGRSPMQSYGQALAAGKQNPQGVTTNVMPMQG